VIQPERRAEQGPTAVVETWKVSRFSFFGSIVPVVQLPIGMVLICVGTILLITDWHNSQRVGFFWIVFVGAVGIRIGTFSLLRVVRQVDALVDGRYRFSSKRKVLTVDPLEIISLRGLTWTDLWGVYPFRMKTSSGGIFIDRHMPDGTDLECKLRRANPRIVVRRAWETSEDNSNPWRNEDL
jgi:hypothetical protein